MHMFTSTSRVIEFGRDLGEDHAVDKALVREGSTNSGLGIVGNEVAMDILSGGVP